MVPAIPAAELFAGVRVLVISVVPVILVPVTVPAYNDGKFPITPLTLVEDTVVAVTVVTHTLVTIAFPAVLYSVSM
jgi:hypothetical protein